MKPGFIFIALLLLASILDAQSLKKYSISNSGCSVYMFCDPGQFEISYSSDSSIVYTAECVNDSLHYGVICIKLKETINAISDAEEMMISYLDYLKTAFSISSAVGYGKGHQLAGYADARGIIDYWKDKNGAEWKIKAWTDGRIIAALYVYANGKLNEPPKVNVFLDGFRFPVK
jgi:hypothetical protein